MLSTDDLALVERFLDDAHALDCSQLNDHLQVDLTTHPRPGFVGALAEFVPEPQTGSPAGSVTGGVTGGVIGYAQASAGNDGFVVDAIVTSEFHGDVDEVRVLLLRHLLGTLPADASITWWTHDDGDSAPLAAELGMRPGRALLQMRRPLPAPHHTDVEVRPFTVGVDEQAWLEVNNAAFDWHSEQGGWDLHALQQRQREPWFRPEGFLLHERQGKLAAFCWTKLHPGRSATDSVVGEIYVIAVHPAFHGLGLGRALTLAGLQAIHAAGASEGMLYVDAGNAPAIRLYEQLGFEVAHTDRAYIRTPQGLPT